MLRILSRSCLLLLACSFFAAPASAQTTTPADVTIRSVTTSGSGCPSNSVSVVVIGSIATVLFSEYNMATSAAQPNMTRDCNVSVKLGLPSGLTLSTTSVAWVGAVILGQGATGKFSRKFYVGGVRKVDTVTRYSTPGAADIALSDTVTGVTISGCRQRDVTISAVTSFALNGAGSAASIDTVDVAGAGMKIALRRGFCR